MARLKKPLANLSRWYNSIPFDYHRLVPDLIIMLVNSIDPLAPYKVSDDLILELVNVSVIIKL
jgi:hypothetical protein